MDILRKPPPLPAGGTVGVVAPSAPHWNRADIDRGVAWWEQRGYRVTLGQHVYRRDGFFAGSVAERVADIHMMFANPKINVIQCLHGGYGATHLIPHLDFDLIRRHPKPFVGRSDISVLHTAIRQRAGLITFYGPGLTQINGPDTPEFNGAQLLRAITSTEPLGPVPRDPTDGYIVPLGSGRAAGKMVGGAIWVLCKTIGTPWQLDARGAILLLEEIDEELWRLDALLTHLRQAGVLEGVVGIVVAELVNCDWDGRRGDGPFPVSLQDVLETHLAPMGLPVLYGYPMGHGKHMTTTPFGVQAFIDADNVTLSLEEAAVG